jgi:hypothetical protein
MKQARLLCLAGLTAISPALLTAATFTQNQGGLLGSESFISADGSQDYTSLEQAGIDFSSYPGGAQGDYTFYIASDTTETSNVAFGNLTNGHTVAIRPTGDVRTVTFTNHAINTGQHGHLVIGAKNLTVPTTLEATAGFLIDGELPGTSQGLILQNDGAVTPAPADYRDAILNVTGDSDHVSLRNLHVINVSPGGPNLTYCINFTSASDGTSVVAPDYCTVFNCHVDALASRTGHGITSHIYNTSTRLPQRDLHITSCTIESGERGILLNQNAGAQIIGNRLRVINNSPSSGFAHGILMTGGAELADFTAEQNQIELVHNGLGGQVIALTTGGGATTNSQASARVINNTVAARITGSAGTLSQLRLVSLTASGYRHVRMLYNSVHLTADAAPVSVGTSPAILGIIGSTLPESPDYTVENNIVQSDVPGVSALRFYKQQPIRSDGNVISVPSGSPVVSYVDTVTTDYLALADWTAATGQDAQSQELDVTGSWVSATDLHLTTVPETMLPALVDEKTIDVQVDVDGDPRDQVSPTRGADEIHVIVPPTPTADLDISTSAPAMLHWHDPFIVTLTVHNGGADTAQDVHVLTTMSPASSTYDPPQLSQGSSSGSNGTYDISLGSIGPGATAFINLGGTAPETNLVETSATVSSSTSDPIPANNTSTASIAVEPTNVVKPDLQVQWQNTYVIRAKHGDRGRTRGQVVVRNIGNAASPVSRLTVVLSSDAVADAGDQLVRSIAIKPLAPGESKVAVINLKPQRGLAGKYLLAVADPDGEIDELSEQNNTDPFGPLP